MPELSIPKKRSNYYYCKVTKNKRPISLSFFKLSLIQICPLSNNQGYALIFKMPTSEYNHQVIHELEKDITEEIVAKNSKWFKNDLTRETIEQLFKSSISQQEFTVYYSNLRPPNTSITNFEQWHYDKKFSMPIQMLCKISCDGLFIYPKKFQLRWMITTMDEYDEENHINDISIDTSEKIEIEDFWKQQYDEIAEKIIATEKKHLDILEKCKQYKQQLQKHLENIQQTDSLKEWNESIESFKKLLLSWNENTFC